MTMPLYEFYCDKCAKEVSVTMTISERGKGQATCPECGSRELRALLGTYFTQPSKKSGEQETPRMKLEAKRTAILAETMYQEMERWVPYYGLREESPDVRVV